jgi:hypothetical protein
MPVSFEVTYCVIKASYELLDNEVNNNDQLYFFFWVIPRRMNFVPTFRNTLSFVVHFIVLTVKPP